MSSESSHHQFQEERRLFRRLADGLLTEDEFRSLEQRLLTDSAFRERYVRHMDLEAGLYTEMEGMTSVSTVNETDHPLASIGTRRQKWIWGSLGLSAAVLVLAPLFLLSASRISLNPEVPTFVEAKLEGLKDVALVTYVNEGLSSHDAKTLKPGLRMKPGVLTLEEGEIELEFFSGAKVVLQGPAELHLLSNNTASLLSGKAAARILEWGKGFALNTPDAAFVDLGTEFAVGVDRDSGSELQVRDGEVEISLLDGNGNTFLSERVQQAKAKVVPRGATGIENKSVPTQGFPRIVDRPVVPLRVSEQYVQSVKNSNPLIYWRFEDPVESLVPNEMGSEWGARVSRDPEEKSDLKIHQGMLEFKHSPEPRYLLTDKPVPGLNADSYTIEFWLNAESLHWGTCFGIIPEGPQAALRHLNVIELAHRSSLIHEAGAFRFLHRYPAERDGGLNLFTPVGCIPGHWYHLVAVKNPDEMKLYVNGEFVMSRTGHMGTDDLSYQILLGQLRDSETTRQFIGAMDEFAFYQHELSADQIQLHYQLMGKPR